MLALAAQWRDLARQARLLTEFEERIEQERRSALSEPSSQALDSTTDASAAAEPATPSV